MARDNFGRPIGLDITNLDVASGTIQDLTTGVPPNQYHLPRNFGDADIGQTIIVDSVLVPPDLVVKTDQLKFGNYDHQDLLNKGSYTHTQIDTYIDSHGGPGDGDAEFKSITTETYVHAGTSLEVGEESKLHGDIIADGNMGLAGTLTLGVAPDASYTLPRSRPGPGFGVANVLRTTDFENMEWYLQDQNLNQTDDVNFNNVTTTLHPESTVTTNTILTKVNKFIDDTGPRVTQTLDDAGNLITKLSDQADNMMTMYNAANRLDMIADKVSIAANVFSIAKGSAELGIDGAELSSQMKMNRHSNAQSSTLEFHDFVSDPPKILKLGEFKDSDDLQVRDQDDNILLDIAPDTSTTSVCQLDVGSIGSLNGKVAISRLNADAPNIAAVEFYTRGNLAPAWSAGLHYTDSSFSLQNVDNVPIVYIQSDGETSIDSGLITQGKADSDVTYRLESQGPTKKARFELSSDQKDTPVYHLEFDSTSHTLAIGTATHDHILFDPDAKTSEIIDSFNGTSVRGDILAVRDDTKLEKLARGDENQVLSVDSSGYVFWKTPVYNMFVHFGGDMNVLNIGATVSYFTFSAPALSPALPVSSATTQFWTPFTIVLKRAIIESDAADETTLLNLYLNGASTLDLQCGGNLTIVNDLNLQIAGTNEVEIVWPFGGGTAGTNPGQTSVSLYFEYS